MKKVITIVAIAAFMFSVDATAQTQKKKEVATAQLKATSNEDAKGKKACCSADKKESISTEKAVASSEKKACGTEAKSSCCSSKKVEAKKED